MKIISAAEIECDQCGAEPHHNCTFMYGQGSRRKRKFRHSFHAKRIRDAEAATRTFNTLMES
jgi:hypothetical protein